MNFTNLLSYTFFGNSFEQLGTALMVFASVYFIFWLIQKGLELKVESFVRNSVTQLDDIFYDLVVSLIRTGGFFFAFFIAQRFLVFSLSIDLIVKKSMSVILALLITWLLQNFLERILDEYFKKLNKSASNSFLPFLKSLLIIFLWAIAAVFILGNMGYTVSSLAAGLGIGGLAIAIALKPTLEAFFASVSIFTDKPFQIGDMIRFGAYSGTVKRIGLRTSTVQTFSGTMLVVPNMELTSSTLENITKRDGERIDANIGLVYETSSENLEKSLKLIRDILVKQEGVETNDVRVWFDAFGDSALLIKFTYFINASLPFVERRDIISEVNLAVKKDFEKAKLEMAFPTQTLYVKK